MLLMERLTRRIGSGANVAFVLTMAAGLALDARRATRGHGELGYVLAFGVVLGAVALLRARNRAWAAAIGLSAFGLAAVISALWPVTPGPLQFAPLIALVVLGTSQARFLRARQATIITAAGVLVVAGAESSHAGGTFDPQALFALFGATVWGGAVAVGVWLRYLDNRQVSTLEAVRSDERLELARELHDVVAHHVTGIVVQAQAARFAGQDHPGSVDAALSSIEGAGSDTLAAVRRLVGLLRDPDDTAGVAPGPEPLDQLVRRFGRHGPAVTLHLPADPSSAAWPPELASTIYRIVQEALTNVARHAPDARSVTVTVAQDPQRVTVEVTDDASTVTNRAIRIPSGYGLIGMRERVEALGGSLHAGPDVKAGWVVRASLPMAARTAS